MRSSIGMMIVTNISNHSNSINIFQSINYLIWITLFLQYNKKSGTKQKPEITNAKEHVAYKNWQNSMDNLERKNIKQKFNKNY